MGSRRGAYALIFLLLLSVEIFIALFVHDRFIRPYVGDILAVGALYALLRVFLPDGRPWLPGLATLVALGVEAGQAFDLVDRLGLGHIPFFRVLIGSVFDWADILCYLAGGVLILGTERILNRT